MKDSSSPIVVAVLVLAGAIGAFFWWRHKQTPPPPPPPGVAAPAPLPDAAPPPAMPDAAVPPPIRHPVQTEGGKLPGLDESDAYVRKALEDLLGRKGVLSYFVVDGFARRFVATVDNLANEQAPARIWPINPAPGQFDVETGPDGSVVTGKNSRRYAPLVKFVGQVDNRKAVALYVRLYPLFQQAYEELGYSGMYFNDRMIEVIDHLMATPDLPGPMKVKLVEAKGATRPLYQFEDPALERKSSGQKILLRLGRDNAATLKAKLAALRAELTRSAPSRKRTRR